MSRTRKYFSTMEDDATSVLLRFPTSTSAACREAGCPWTHPAVEGGLPSSPSPRSASDTVCGRSADVVLSAAIEISSR